MHDDLDHGLDELVIGDLIVVVTVDLFHNLVPDAYLADLTLHVVDIVVSGAVEHVF